MGPPEFCLKTALYTQSNHQNCYIYLHLRPSRTKRKELMKNSPKYSTSKSTYSIYTLRQMHELCEAKATYFSAEFIYLR